MTYRRHALLIASLGLFIVRCRAKVYFALDRAKSKTKAALKHSTLRGAMTRSFHKALLKTTTAFCTRKVTTNM